MASIAAQVAALQTMTIDQLQARWKEVFGEETRQRHRQHLIKRLARQMQDDRPGLTAEEEAKVDRYRAMLKQMPPEKWFPGARHNRPKRPASTPKRRSLMPGSVLTRVWDGAEIAVTVREDGRFDYAGRTYRSLSAVAKEVTGTTWNGWRFFGLAPIGGKR
ncbi:MAG: DUF2924 domain-containing protein [Krumholzibacteria bacterium]|nr:DUF2924 domain-containing protein [Candidatus Krumholzibacteria bacterium]